MNPENEPRPFVTTRECSYQEHAARIAKMIEEGLHDGERWKPEARERYTELERDFNCDFSGAVAHTQTGGVAYLAHVGGLIFGAVTARFFEGPRRLAVQPPGDRFNNPGHDPIQDY